MLSCPICTAENPSGARFCNQCGARLEPARVQSEGYTPRHLLEQVLREPAAVQGERKRVTVLFADIKGSTRLAQQAGAEAWHGILDRFFAILANAVHRYEGTVNQYTGDGIMALFGAPVAQEDHAVRACHAALEMQRDIRRYADELRLRQGLNLSMRVGLNSGEVIVGRIGDDLRMDYTAQGPTVHLAARVEHLCEPGRVYLTRHTARQVEPYFQLRELGPLQPHGMDEALEIFELERALPNPSRLHASLARAGSPFVGRAPELRQLLNALDRARSGQGQIVAVIGAAGIGKSRLCHEFTRACTDAGIPVHRGSGVPYHNAAPMHPLRMLARSRMGLPAEAAPEEVRRLVAGTLLMHNPQYSSLLPAVFDFFGVASGAPAKAAETAPPSGSLLATLLAEYLCCADGPQVLLIEDLHFLDPASETLLRALCAEVPKHPTLLLLNYRPEYVSEPLIPLLDEQIHISALSQDHVERLAQNLLGVDDSVSHLPAVLAARASGNPFFVEEAVLTLADAGYLTGQRGAYRLGQAVDAWMIPDSVHALIAARIDRLPQSLRELLQLAAVLGQCFERDLLAELQGRDSATIDEQLETLQDLGLVREVADGEYRFCHPLMQEVAYQVQLESRRAASHLHIAERLTGRVNPEPAEAALRIAHHWHCAGRLAEAGFWSILAGRWAASRDMGLAVQQLQNAIRWLDQVPLSPKTGRQRILARAALIRMAPFVSLPSQDIDEAYQAARALLPQFGDLPTTAELMISYGNELLHRGQAARGADVVEAAARHCLSAGEHALVHRFRLAILLVHSSAGRPREGLALLDAAGIEWRTRPVDEENYMSRGYYGLMLLWMGRLTEAERNLREAVAVAERAQQAGSWIQGRLADLAYFSGDYRDALPAAEQALARAQALGSPFFLALAESARAQAYCLHGRFEEAVACLEPVIALTAPGCAAHQFQAQHQGALAMAYGGAGRSQESLQMARAAIDSGRRSGSRVGEIAGWSALLRLPRRLRAEVDPEAALARLGALLVETGAQGFSPWYCLFQAHWCDQATDRKRLLDQAAEAFADMGAQPYADALRQNQPLPLLRFLEQ